MSLACQLDDALGEGRSLPLARRLRIASSVGYVSVTKCPVVPEGFMETRKLITALKSGDPDAARQCARIMAKHSLLRGFRGVVVPAPRSSAERPSHILLAKELVKAGVGEKAVDAIKRIEAVPSSRLRRQKGLQGVSYDEHVKTMEASGLAPGSAVLVVDDMFTTGNTLRAAAAAIRRSGHTGEILGATAGYDMTSDGCRPAGNPYKHVSFSA